MGRIYKYADRYMVEFDNKSRASYSRKRYGPLLDKIAELSLSENKKIWNYYEIENNYLYIYYYKQNTNEVIKFVTDAEFQYLVYDFYFQLNCNGYVVSRTNGKKTYLHHIVIGSTNIVDHINGIRYDNRRENLRETTPSLNLLNRHFMSSNTSGEIGVSWSSKEQKWRARVEYLGNEKSRYFDSFEQAVECRRQWVQEIFDEYYGRSND